MNMRHVAIALVLVLCLLPASSGNAREERAATVHLVIHPPHATAINTLAASRDGRVAITCASDDPACVWDATTGRLLRRVPVGGRPNLLPIVAASDDGARVVVTSSVTDAVVFDVATGEEVRRVDAMGATLTALAFSPDGSTVVVGDDRGVITGWSGTSKKPRWQHKVHGGAIPALDVVDDGGLVVTGGADGKVHATTVSGRDRAECDVSSGKVTHVAATSDGVWLAAADEGGGLRVWSCKAPQRPLHVLTASGPAFVGLVFSDDGEMLYAAHAAGGLRRWRLDAKEAEELPALPAQDKPWNHVMPAGPGHVLVAADSWAQLVNVETGLVDMTLGAPCFHPHEIETSPGGQLLLVSGSDGIQGTLVEIYDLFLGRCLWRIPSSGARMAMACSPDERHIVLTPPDGQAVVMDVESGEVVHRLAGTTGPVFGAAWSLDGYRIALATGNGAITLYDATTGKEAARWQGLAGTVRKLAFSPRGDLLLAATETAGLLVLDASDGHRVFELPYTEFLQGVAFGAAGTMLHHTTGIPSTTERELPTGKLRAVYPGKVKGKMESGHDQMVTCLAVSPDGGLLATGSWDATICVWDTKTGKRLHRLPGHDGDVTDLAFGPEAKRLISAGEDRTIRFWDLESGSQVGTLVSADVPVPEAQQKVRTGLTAWCAFDAEGRFDASTPTGFAFLNWTDGARTWAFEELLEGRRSPGLLAALGWGTTHPLRALDNLPIPSLPPKVRAEVPDPSQPVIKVAVENRGGGIGAVAVKLNGREVVKDARGATVSSSAPREDLDVDLSSAPNLLPGESNVVEVSAYDAKGTARARGPVVSFEAPGLKLDPPELWIVTCGVSDYAGDALDLTFPAKDATAVAAAFELAGSNHFRADRTHVLRLASPAGDGEAPATRQALGDALQRVAASAKANDTFLLYLAGHGVSDGSAGAYRYLLADASDASTTDAAFSDADLVAALARIPCNHRAVFLDTCASGRVRDVLQALGGPDGAVKRLHEREGVFVLAGCAADRLSYESSIYGQGLLTYSVLFGLSCGCHFKDEVYVDVGRLIDFACDEVPRLSKRMGLASPQRPVKADGDQSFPLGRLTLEERTHVQVAQPLPGFVHSSFQRVRPPTDTHGLRAAVDAAVRRLSNVEVGRPPAVFVETERMVGAWQIAGTYSLQGPDARVKVSLLKLGVVDAEVVAELEITKAVETPEQIAALADEIVAQAIAHLPP